MPLDMGTMKKPQTWAVIIPVLLLIWAAEATVSMHGKRATAQNTIRTASQMGGIANDIDIMIKKAGGDASAAAQLEDFDLVTSTLKCAEAAAISPNRLSRGDSSAPKKQKNSTSLQYTENLKLTGVRMMQLAKFIEYAERNFSSLTCDQLSIVPSHGQKTKDTWDVTVTFRYTK